MWNNKIPFAFLTNGTYTSDTITKKMSTLLDLPFNKGHSIVAPSPCLDLTEYHNKNVLVCCQEEAIDLIKESVQLLYLSIESLDNAWWKYYIINILLKAWISIIYNNTRAIQFVPRIGLC